MATSFDNKYIISASLDNALYLWSFGNKELIRKIKFYDGAITSIKTTSDQKYSLVISAGNKLNLMSIESLR